MKRLNLYCLIGGLLLVFIGTTRIVNFSENPILPSFSSSYKIGQYTGLALIPLFGLLMLIESIRRFKLEN